MFLYWIVVREFPRCFFCFCGLFVLVFIYLQLYIFCIDVGFIFLICYPFFLFLVIIFSFDFPLYISPAEFLFFLCLFLGVSSLMFRYVYDAPFLLRSRIVIAILLGNSAGVCHAFCSPSNRCVKLLYFNFHSCVLRCVDVFVSFFGAVLASWLDF